jgi:type IV pilus assembly protein PilB
MSEEYLIQCWYCLGEYDAGSAVWCGCDPKSPTKLCPYCLQCFCRSTDEYRNRFFQYAPESLLAERSSLRKIKDRLGELLVRAQILTVEDLLSALNQQSVTGNKLGQVLVDSNIISSEELEIFLKIQTVPVPNEFSEEFIDSETLHRLHPEFCLQAKIIPLRVFRGSNRSFLALAMANPRDLSAIEIVSRKTEMFIVPFYSDEFAIVNFLKNALPPGGARIVEQETIDYQGIVRKIIVGAIKRNASDIHIEPDQHELNIRYRIDGVLYKIKSPAKREQGPLFTALKKLAKMDLQRSGVPQSSKMFLKQGEKKYQLNILTFPNPHGESIGIKIVDLNTFLRDLQELGFSPDEFALICHTLESSSGLVLISGPLMNGCNTTQYAMMGKFSKSNRKVMTLESPIFSNIPGVHQSEINPAIGFDFKTGLSSIIRSDPDVIFLSDIPDADSAATVCKASAKSLVIATVTALSSAGTIVMLREFGTSPSLLSQCLSLIVNQRLIRRICAHCCERMPISQSMLVRMGLTESEAADLNAYVGVGCKDCNYLGFSGRVAIFEVMKSNTAIREAIAQGATAKEIEALAADHGMMTLRKRSLERVNQGITTLEEFQRCKFPPPEPTITRQ